MKRFPIFSETLRAATFQVNGGFLHHRFPFFKKAQSTLQTLPHSPMNRDIHTLPFKALT